MFLARQISKKAAILCDDVIFLRGWKFSLSSIFTICDLLFSIPVMHPDLHIYSVVLFPDVEIKIADVIIFWKIMKKLKTWNFLILLWWQKLQNDNVIIFETCDQIIFITYILKIKCIKFHGFSMKRTGFIVIFLLRAKKPHPVFEKFKKSRLR